MELLGTLGAKILLSLAAAFAGWLVMKWAKAKRKEARHEQAKRDVQPLKDAVTAEEIDRATDDALDHF